MEKILTFDHKEILQINGFSFPILLLLQSESSFLDISIHEIHVNYNQMYLLLTYLYHLNWHLTFLINSSYQFL